MQPDRVLVDVEDLTAVCLAVLRASGLDDRAATLATDAMVRSSLRGVETHGVNALGIYARHVREGGASSATQLEIAVDRGALVVADAQAALGPVGGRIATDLAIERSRQFGVATVSVRNANHFGAAGYFALLCAEADCIGLVLSNTPPIMAATGSRARSIGNSPLGFGAPRDDAPPFVLDVAMSRVAGGKVRLALARGEQVPLGWILGPDGEPSVDPADFFERRGALLPMEEHKGYGLALMVETLAGALSGASMLSAISNFLYEPAAPGGIGYFLHVIDVSPTSAFPDFAERMAALCREVGSAPLAPGHSRVRIPGEEAARREADAGRRGFEMPVSDWRRLTLEATTAGCRVPSVRGPS